MRYFILSILFLSSCSKIDILPDKISNKVSKEHPKGVAIIDTEIFLKKKCRVNYKSSNKSVFYDNDVMTLLIIKDTLKLGEQLHVNLFSQDHENQMAYKIVCVNKHIVLRNGTTDSYMIGSGLVTIVDSLIN